MRAIRKKMESQRGASITFGLLLFLVSAVLCSVIIVAATTAAGRMSRLAETDQRYYAVTSAAELLKDMLDGKPVCVVKVTTSHSSITYTDGVPGTEVPDDDAKSVEYLLGDNDLNPDEIVERLRTNDRVNLILTSAKELDNVQQKNLQTVTAYHYYSAVRTNPAAVPATKTLNLSSGAAASADPIAVTINEVFDANGNISMLLYNTGTDRFTQNLQFTMSDAVSEFVERTESEPSGYQTWETTEEEGGEVKITPHSSYKITITTKETQIRTFSWSL